MSDERARSPRRAPLGRDSAAIFGVALAARLAIVAWAASRFPPAADGVYYQRIAERIAMGLGYTWLWPDGAVTYAAHYPIGYPGMVGAIYALTGAHPIFAMLFNAALGALAAFAVHRLAARAVSRRLALAAGLLVALHPGLVFYTPALMTEGVTAALIACAASTAAWARDRRAHLAWGAIAIGLVIGVATLVRPQSLVLAPAFALLALPERAQNARIARFWRGASARCALAPAALATLTALALCAPWTARNCARMGRCALVSVNGGWNLLIGADTASTGAWSPIKVPDACREVYDEAEKDECFGRAARRFIAERPLAWLSLVPRKLAATFDYAGAAGYYLHASNPEAFDERQKTTLGVLETVYERVLLLLALVAAARAGGPRPRARFSSAAVGVVFVFTLHAWVSYAAYALTSLLRGRALLRGPVLPASAAFTVLSTLLVHAVFFGAGRYSLVIFPLLSAAAMLALSKDRPRDFDSE